MIHVLLLRVSIDCVSHASIPPCWILCTRLNNVTGRWKRYNFRCWHISSTPALSRISVTTTLSCREMFGRVSLHSRSSVTKYGLKESQCTSSFIFFEGVLTWLSYHSATLRSKASLGWDTLYIAYKDLASFWRSFCRPSLVSLYSCKSVLRFAETSQ